MSLRQLAKADKRRRIFLAAKRAFVARGFAEATIRSIAQEAGVATGTVFLYAPDKRTLLALVFCDEVAEVERTALARLGRRDRLGKLRVSERLMVLFASFFRYYGRDLELSRTFLKELLFASQEVPQVAVATRSFVTTIARLFDEGRASGEVKEEVAPQQAAGIVFGIYWVCLLAWLGGALPTERAALAQLRSSIDLVLAGMGRTPSRGD